MPRRNQISGTPNPLPRLMWADCDYTDSGQPVAIYNTRAEQQANRPDLKPRRVVVIALDNTADVAATELFNAWSATHKTRRRSR